MYIMISLKHCQYFSLDGKKFLYVIFGASRDEYFLLILETSQYPGQG